MNETGGQWLFMLMLPETPRELGLNGVFHTSGWDGHVLKQVVNCHAFSLICSHPWDHEHNLEMPNHLMGGHPWNQHDSRAACHSNSLLWVQGPSAAVDSSTPRDLSSSLAAGTANSHQQPLHSTRTSTWLWAISHQYRNVLFELSDISWYFRRGAWSTRKDDFQQHCDLPKNDLTGSGTATQPLHHASCRN